MVVKMTLKAARINVGLTQKEAAEVFGISNKTLSSWESGASSPRAEQVPKICEVYKVTYDNLIF